VDIENARLRDEFLITETVNGNDVDEDGWLKSFSSA
jgi:hypothetical protein